MNRKWVWVALVSGVVVLAQWGQRRLAEKRRADRRATERWEGEGGAVPPAGTAEDATGGLSPPFRRAS